jgi:hypothetical protein
MPKYSYNYKFILKSLQNIYEIQWLALGIGKWAWLGLIFRVILSFFLEDGIKSSFPFLRLFLPKHLFVSISTVNTSLHFSATFNVWDTFTYGLHDILGLSNGLY